MPIANFEQYCNMLDSAKKNQFAYPAINVTSLATANACLQAFAEKKSDGIIQVSIGGGAFASGISLKDSVLGTIVLAEAIHRLAEKYNIYIALHTDHCPPDRVDDFLVHLIVETENRRRNKQSNLFQSHMFDGSILPLKENMTIAKSLLERCTQNSIILEVEAGVVGGEEDGVDNENVDKEKLYTTSEDMLKVYRSLNSIKNARFLFAATFGNVHGVYKPGNVQLKPKILRDGQNAIKQAFGKDASFDLVFHGGSGSSKAEIKETLSYGVVKMNVDTDTQYAFTRPIVDHVFTNYQKVLKIEGEMGSKKYYDPRTYIKLAEKNMIKRVEEAIEDLNASNHSIFSR